MDLDIIEKRKNIGDDGRVFSEDDVTSYKSGYTDKESRAGPKLNRSMQFDDQRVNNRA